MTAERRSPAWAEYTLESFQAAYDLPLAEAVDLFTRFGPLKTSLDVLMKAIIDRRTAGKSRTTTT